MDKNKNQYVIVADGNHIGRKCYPMTLKEFLVRFPGWRVLFPLSELEATQECNRLNSGYQIDSKQDTE